MSRLPGISPWSEFFAAQDAVGPCSSDLAYFVGVARSASDSFLETETFRRAQDSQAAAIKQSAARWQRNVLNPLAPNSVDAISETVDAVFETLSRFGPGALDVTALQVDAINAEHLSAALRSSSNWRSQVPGWHDALQVAAKAFERQGIPAGSALFGLL